MATPEELIAMGVKDADSFSIGMKQGEQSMLNSIQNAMDTSAEHLTKIDGLTAFRMFHAIFQSQHDKGN